MAGFRAKFPSMCTGDCGEINPGDLIEVDPEGGWRHVNCPEADDHLTDDPRYGPLCPMCTTHHRGECP